MPKENHKNGWFDAECGISVYKFKGQENTFQTFNGTKEQILTCLSTMTEQLLKLNIVSIDELLRAINLPINKLKGEK